VTLVRLVRIGVPDFPIDLVWMYVMAAFLVATLIGIVAGIVPARRAAQLDPVEALRTE